MGLHITKAVIDQLGGPLKLTLDQLARGVTEQCVLSNNGLPNARWMGRASPISNEKRAMDYEVLQVRLNMLFKLNLRLVDLKACTTAGEVIMLVNSALRAKANDQRARILSNDQMKLIAGALNSVQVLRLDHFELKFHDESDYRVFRWVRFFDKSKFPEVTIELNIGIYARPGVESAVEKYRDVDTFIIAYIEAYAAASAAPATSDNQ